MKSAVSTATKASEIANKIFLGYHFPIADPTDIKVKKYGVSFTSNVEKKPLKLEIEVNYKTQENWEEIILRITEILRSIE
jgi:hypothetical protein